MRRSIAAKGSWQQYGPYARRAVAWLVEIALETNAYDKGLGDLESVPAHAPPEVRAEIAYLRGRAKQAAGDADGPTSLEASSCSGAGSEPVFSTATRSLRSRS